MLNPNVQCGLTPYTSSIYHDEVTLIAPLLLWRSNNEQGWERKCVADGLLAVVFIWALWV